MMSASLLAKLIQKQCRIVPDFPVKGVPFKDITSLFNDPFILREISSWMLGVVDEIQERHDDGSLLALGAVESRGFVLASAVAARRMLPLVLFRKPGKLPRATLQETYKKEYGEDTLCAHEEDLKVHKRILIIDDVLATGGTIIAANRIARRAGLVPHNAFIFDLSYLRPAGFSTECESSHALVTE